MVFVFYFSLCKSGFTFCAPVYRLKAPINKSVFCKFIKTRHYCFFILRFQGQVWIVPVSEYPEPLKFTPLDAYEFHCKFMGHFSELHLVHVMLCLFHFLKKLVFNRHAMAVPARHIRCVIPLHCLKFYDYVFQGFIQGVAYVDIAVCIRRPIVKNILRSPFLLLPYHFIEIHLLPFFKDKRLFFRKIPLHRKISFWQI